MPDIDSKEQSIPVQTKPAEVSSSKEVKKEPTIGDFVEHKKQILKRQNEQVEDVYEKTLVDPINTYKSYDILRRKRDGLHFEIGQLEQTTSVLAQKQLEIIMPEAGKHYEELNQAEKEQLMGPVLQTSLIEFIDQFEEMTNVGEKAYKEKYGGKKYDQMSVDERDEAQEDARYLDVRQNLVSEMAQFKK